MYTAGVAAILILVTIVVIITKYGSKARKNSQAIGEKEYREKIEHYVEPVDMNSLPPMQQLIHAIRKQAVEISGCSILNDEAVKLWRISEEGNRPLLVLVMGEFKTGKSTFINALLEADVLKTDAAPATAVVSILRYGKKPQVLLHHGDGSVTRYKFNKLAEITAEGNESKQALRDSLEYVEIFYPNEMLKKINLVDTPGLNVHKESHIKSTEHFQSTADVVLWVFNATRSATRTEIAAIEALGGRLKPFAIVNRIDNIDEEEETVEEVLNSVRKRLGKFVYDVIGVSARQAREAEVNKNDALLKSSGWRGFLAKLDSHFIECADHLKLNSIKEKIKEFAIEFERNLQSQEKASRDQEKNFSDQKTAVANLNNAITNLGEAEQAAIEGCQRIAEAAEHFTAKYNDASQEALFDEEPDKMAEELLSCINDFLPFVDFLKDEEKAQAFIEDINMLNAEIDKEVVLFRGWFNRCRELMSESRNLDSEKEHIVELQREYENSGLFGGEPIFDFSGRRARVNKAVDMYNGDLKEFQRQIKYHWFHYQSLCLDVIEKNEDISEVGEKLAEFLAGEKAECKEALQRLENNFEKERAQHLALKKELDKGQRIHRELQNIVVDF